MTKKDFEALKLYSRLKLLSKEGEHIGMRMVGHQKVHLYAIDGLFVEVFVIPGSEQVQWAEVQTNHRILAEYSASIDLRKLW